MVQNQTSDQMKMFGYTAEGVQQEVDKYIDKDAAPAKDITFMDAAKFVAELTPVIGDAMAAKEVYDELQKDDPNYLLAGALGGATIIGLIPGIGDAAAAAIRTGAKKALDVAKRVEVDPDAVGMFGGNLRAKGYDEPSEKTLELMRKKFPAMEARDEVYRIGEKKDPKSFYDAIDVKVGPEKKLIEVPTYPAEPERRSVLYDPDRAKVVFIKDIDTLNTGEVVDMSRNRIVPTKGSLKIEDLVEPDDNVLYRGMSAEEYRGALDQGYIKSKGDYNIGTDQQGLTFYSTNPSQAQNYANDFTPGGFRATPDRPAYVVAIKKPEKIDYVTGQTEFGIKKEVPTSEIVEVFEGQPYMYQGDVDIVDDFGGPKVSGSSPDTAQVTWEKIGKPSDSKPVIKEGVPTIKAAGLTDEAIETWRKKNATSPEFRKALKGRDEELMDLAAGVKEGRVFNTTYRKRVDELRPIRKVKDVPKPSNVKEIVSALDSGKRKSPIVGLNYEIPDGEVITARLDIPAYVDYDTWIPTLRHASKTMYKAALRMKNVKFIQPEGREVGSALDVAVGPQRLEETFGLTKKKAQAKGNKSPFAVMEGNYVDGTDDELFTMAKEIFDSDEWTQVGYDPVKRGFFYDRETGQAILEADEVIQVGHLVLAKNAKKTDPDVFSFNEGGMAMDDQMKMAFMDEGGIIDDDLDVDPVSGNEVPPGSLAEEVRDDIPAQLSEGEYVVPADVVRYYGVKFFEDLRDQAKMGLAEMEANGRIGGEPVPAGGPINDEELSEQEMSAIRQMMTGMAEGGEVQNPYLQQQQLYSQPRPAPIDEKRNTTITGINPVENQMPMQSMADGGQVQGYQDSSVVTQPDDDIPSFAQNQFNPAQYGLGFSFMGQPQQAGTTPSQAPQGQTLVTLYHPEYATNGRSKTFYLPRDNEIYQQYLGMGYTKQMPMTGSAETPTTDTPVTTGTTGTKGGSGGSGANITTGGGTGKGFSFGFKNWGEDVDWTSSDAIMKFVEESQKGLIDPKTGNRLTAIGAAAGPLGAIAGATAGNLPTLQSVSDLRAAAIIARSQGLDETASSIDQQVQDMLKQSSGITRFVDKFFNETVDGDAKGKARLDNLGFEYTVDEKTGNPIFSAEQIAANKAKSSKPKQEPIISTASSGPTGIAGERIVSTPTKPQTVSTQKESEAAARKRKKDRRDYQKQRGALMKKRRDTAVKKAKSISKDVKGKGAKAVDARKKSGAFDKGGLMNKKGKK